METSGLINKVSFFFKSLKADVKFITSYKSILLILTIHEASLSCNILCDVMSLSTSTSSNEVMDLSIITSPIL